MTKAKTHDTGWDTQAPLDLMAHASRENFESLAKASSIATDGVGAIGRLWFDFAKASIEQATEASKAIMAAKNVGDMVASQADFAKSALDRYVAESNRATELGFKTASDAMAPIQARVEHVVTEVSKSA